MGRGLSTPAVPGDLLATAEHDQHDAKNMPTVFATDPLFTEFHTSSHYPDVRPAYAPSTAWTSCLFVYTTMWTTETELASRRGSPSPRSGPPVDSPFQDEASFEQDDLSSSSNSKSQLDIKRRKRTSPEALAVLTNEFIFNPLPSAAKRTELAAKLNM